MHELARLDLRFVWHPFTQMRDWARREPIVIVSGRGSVLRDARGREYLDANASIWTNLHGHAHPRLNAALRRQLARISHSSALGLANEPASRLAAELVRLAHPRRRLAPRLAKVFFSDDGSTALEVALKLAWEFTRRTRGHVKPRFLSLQGAYHGDTLGAVALGHIDLFHRAFGGMLYRTDAVMAPYCYRCPYNRARPERADARATRQCRWECLDHVERAFARARTQGRPFAAFVFEPRVQGAAGMIAQPPGWLARATAIARGHGALLIADEVMTGFGRTGTGVTTAPGVNRDAKPEGTPATPAVATTTPTKANAPGPLLFACHHEQVQPDFLCLAKGLSGGYLPLAATLTTRAVFDAFLGRYDEFRTFFHGHSYTGNQLGCAAGLASLELLEAPDAVRRRLALERLLAAKLATLWDLPAVGDIRHEGLVAGIELVRDGRTRLPFDLRERVGIRVCEAMATRGVLTRPIGNVIVLMPPYSTTPSQLRTMVRVLADAIREVTSAP
jgi:adenosylmethionine-8-amino-7-oxononanoate aminotransferase